MAGLARAVHGDPANEVRLANLVGIVLCLYIGTALVSTPHWHRAFWVAQLVVWVALLVCGAWFTYYDEQSGHDNNDTDRNNQYHRRVVIVGGPPFSPSGRRDLFAEKGRRAGSDRSLGSVGSGVFTASSHKSRRSTGGGSAFGGKHPIVAVALGVVMVGTVLQTFESAMDETMSYMGDVELVTR
jgi:hypothetical protein